MSWARRDFRPITLGDAKSRDRRAPQIEDEDENDLFAAPQSVICHLSFFPSAVYHNPDF